MMNPLARIFLTMLITFALVVALYHTTAAEILGVWLRSDTFAHGLLVLPIVAWLIWRSRDRLEGLTPRPWLLGCVALLVSGLGWLLGALANTASVMHFFLALIVISAEAALLGARITRVLAFPFLFLLFCVPIGEFLLPVMMDYTAEFTVSALRASGVPVYQEGLHFVVPNGRWSVVEACSGVRYLIASAMVGTLYAYLSYRSLKRRLTFVLVSFLVPVVANWLRAYMVVMLGYLSDNRIATGVDHLIYGWIFFGVVILLMFSVGRRWRDDLDAREPALQLPALPPLRKGVGGAAMVLPLILLALPPMLAARAELSSDGTGVPAFVPLAATEGWKEIAGARADFRPRFEGFRSESLAHYEREAKQVSLYVAVYGQQSQGHELVHSRNTLISPYDERFSRRKVLNGLEVKHGQWLESVISSPSGVLVSRSGYWVDGRLLSNDYMAKALLLLERLEGKSDTSAFAAVWSEAVDEATARRQLDEFFADYGEAIMAHLKRLSPGP